jgi:Flp pilus assembly protein TadG
MANKSTSGRSCKGQDLVEFAILLPVLALFIFGAVDLGRLFYAAISVENAARVGARFAARNPGTDTASLDAIRTVTRNEAQNSSLLLAATTVNPTFPGGAVPGQPAVVQVIYNFPLILGNLIGNPSLTITRSAQMLIP